MKSSVQTKKQIKDRLVKKPIRSSSGGGQPILTRSKANGSLRPTILKEDLVSVLRCMLSDKLTEVDGGTMTTAFEKSFAQVVGKQDALFVVNDSAAFYLILTSLGIGKGEHVLASPLIEPQVWEAIRRVGATLDFVDCAKQSFSMGERALRAKLTPETRALVLSHAFGFSHQQTARLIKGLRQDFPKLKIIEEGLYALGTTYVSNNRTVHVGTLGDYGVFSLASNRTLTAAKGAMIIANHSEQLLTLRELRTPVFFSARTVSQKKSPRFSQQLAKTAGSSKISLPKATTRPQQQPVNRSGSLAVPGEPLEGGANFSRLDLAPTELEAALGLSQLQFHKQFMIRRQELVAQFQGCLPKRTEVKILTQLAGVSNARFISLYFPSGKATAYERFKRVGLENVLLNFYTLYGYLEQHKLQRDYAMTGLPEVQDLHRRVLLVPIHAGMEKDEITTIEAVLKSL